MATWTAKKSGYLAAAAAVTWTSGGPNSLASNTYSGLSDEIDNSTNKYAYADLDLVLGSAAFTGTDSGIEVYIVPTVDGTNYPTWTGNTTSDAPENLNHYATFVRLKAATQAQRAATPADQPVVLPQGKFKFGLRSRANVTLAGSGNTLSWRPHTVAI